MSFIYNSKKSRCFLTVIALQLLFSFAVFGAPSKEVPIPSQPMRVATAGTAPFVIIDKDSTEGIAVEIWRDVATHAGWEYKFVHYPSVPDALMALQRHQVDVVVGPTSISSERARLFEFTQPYFQSSVSLLSPVTDPTAWQRIVPFFSKAFFIAFSVLLIFLFIVGFLLWLVEHRQEGSDFPADPVPGIANGMWCAIVTMSTVGYGDISPKTTAGRIIAALWMLVSIVAATSLVAGIASSLALPRTATRTITTAEDLHNHNVAILGGSPAQSFAEHYGAKITSVTSLEQGYQLLQKQQVDAVIFDRPQLLYFLRQNHDPHVKISTAQYQPQGYGFVFPLNSALGHQANVRLLQMEESGRVDQIVEMWLGNGDES